MEQSDKQWLALKAVFGVFILSFFVGVLNGLLKRDNLAHSQIISSMRLMDLEGKIYLGLRCNRAYSFIFDPDTQIIDRDPSQIGSTALARTLNISTHKDIIFAFIGGSTGALTLQKIFRHSNRTPGKWKSNKATKLISTIFGAISGYLLGYWAGTYSSDDCDSWAVSSALTNPQNWNEFGRSFFWLSVYELGYIDTRFERQSRVGTRLWLRRRMFQEGPIMNCESDVGEELMQSIEHANSGAILRGKEFEAILAFERERNMLLASSGFREFKTCLNKVSENCFTQNLCDLLGGDYVEED